MYVPRIPLDEAERRFSTDPQTVFLDTRSDDAWTKASQIVPGAIRIPPDEVDAHIQEIPRDRPIITYCT